MPKLISETIIDPTNNSFYWESGDNTEFWNIDHELYYPSLRTVKIYTITASEVVSSKEDFKKFAIINDKLSLCDSLSFFPIATFETKISHIEYRVVEDQSGNIKILVVADEKLVLLEERFACLVDKAELLIIDSQDNIAQTIRISSPKNGIIDLRICYLPSGQVGEKYSLTNFFWNDYKKPLFREYLSQIKIVIG